MRCISVSAASRGKLSSLVNEARDGGLILITRKGAPAAYLVPADLVEAVASFDRPEIAVPACRCIRDLLKT